MMTSITKKITPVVKALDAVVPGWFHLVDEKSLSMVDPFNCIVGQLTGQNSIGVSWSDRRITPVFQKLMTELEAVAPPDADVKLVLANFDDKWKKIIREKRRQ